MDLQRLLITELAKLSANAIPVDYRHSGYHLEVQVDKQQLRDLARVMRRMEFYLVFVTAVHLDPQMEIVYQFAHYHHPCRTVARTFVGSDGSVPTISDIFNGANWHERETRDMFGVLFSGHPYLQPLLLPEEEADLKPLFKEPSSLKAVDGVRRKSQPPDDRSAGKSGPGPAAKVE